MFIIRSNIIKSVFCNISLKIRFVLIKLKAHIILEENTFHADNLRTTTIPQIVKTNTNKRLILFQKL